MTIELICQETSDRFTFNDCDKFIIEDIINVRNYCDLSVTLYVDMSQHLEFIDRISDMYQKDIIVEIPLIGAKVNLKKVGIIANDAYIRLFGEELEWI